MINVIYVTEENMYDDAIQNIKNSLTAKIVFSILIIVILGFIVLLITFYLINSIATNILRPIKMMNNILVEINSDKALPENSNLDTLKNSKLKNSNFTNIKAYQKLNEEENEYENEDDDLLDIRSEDIDVLFQTLIDLKKTLQYVQVNPDNDNEYKLLNLLFAKNTFNNIHNIPARLLCNSNLGNLAIKFKKYDKAIIHLWESIKLTDYHIKKDNDYFNEFKEFLSKFNEKNEKFDEKIVGIFDKSDPNEKKSHKHSLQLEMENKVNLESRIPKLIFAFKKFFKNINKILKIMIHDPKFEKIIDNIDLFYKGNVDNFKNDEIYYIYREKLIENFLKIDIYSDNCYHNLSNFKKIIDQYLGQAIETKNTRLKILAEFELIDFVIKYILFPMEYNFKTTNKIQNSLFLNSSNNNETKINVYNRNQSDLEARIKDLREKLKNQIEETYQVILGDNKDSTEKYLISKKLSKKYYLEYSDLPKSVLLQRIVFLNAKFNLIYDLKEFFYKLNSITKFQDDVIDAVVLTSSYKKLKKVFKQIVNKI